MIRRENKLSLIQKYMKHVQNGNVPMVNEALNELYVEEEDYTSLRESIDTYDNFDQISLATSLRDHDLLEFRRISAYLYKMSKRWKQSIELSKRDNLWQDAMETAAESGDSDLAEEIIRYFVDNPETPKSCFAACLYTCFHLLRPDVVLELAWRQNLTEVAMPFMVQAFRNFSDKIGGLEAKLAKMESTAEEAKQQAQKEQEAAANNAANDMYGQGPLMLTAAPQQGYMPQQPAYGMPPMQPPQGGGY